MVDVNTIVLENGVEYTEVDYLTHNDVKYVLDIFPYYGSDIGAAWRSGVDCAGALIGPGVHASHGMERTHYKAIENTIKLLVAYLTK